MEIKGKSGKYKRTEKHSRNISESLKGHMVSEKTRRKISKSMIGGNQTSFKIGHKTNLNKSFPKDEYPNYAMRNKKHSERTKKLMSKNHPNFNGINNPNYIDGNSYFPYSGDFSRKLKIKIKERDNNQCKFPKENHFGRLEIHHIDFNKNNNSEKNLITLCHHHNIQANKDRINFQNILMEMLK